MVTVVPSRLGGPYTAVTSSDSGGDDQERDGQLFDLLKSLHSSRMGIQCETIVRFPRLMERYPFPVLVNSAFLGLGDVFIGGSNLLRFYILKVAQQTRKHHDKITSVDELAKRIFSVIHSNDPIARALTLRTIGYLAGILAERKSIHHSISSSLDSNDLVELEAAIAAAKQYAEQSGSFAGSICQKLASTIQGLETPVDVKLKLIPIFQNMHHDAQTVAKVREVCTDLLLQYPSVQFVSTTLSTLSQLAAKSLMDLPQQVELLLDYLEKDPRRVIQGQAVRNLYLLANKAPHMWTAQNIQALSEYVLRSRSEDLKLSALTVLSKLSETIAVSNMAPHAESAVMRVCCVCTCDQSVKMALRATQLLTNIAVYNFRAETGTRQDELLEHAATSTETLLVLCTTDFTASTASLLKMCLRCVVLLCNTTPGGADRFVDVIHSSFGFVPGEQEELLCECLSAVGRVRSDLLPALVPDLSAHLTQLSEKQPPPEDLHNRLLRITTILLQAYSECQLPGDVEGTVETCVGVTNCWVVYRIARQATRFGHYSLATKLFISLNNRVWTEQFHFWISALREVSRAEQCVLSGTGEANSVQQLCAATVHYQKAMAALKAATTPEVTLSFQLRYCELRTTLLQTHVQLYRACASFKTSPPPAIATSLAMTTGDEVHKYGHVVEQLRKCCAQFEQLYSKYDELYRVSFDADPASLQHVQLLQQQCQMMTCVLHKILVRFQRSGKQKSVQLGSVPGDGAMATAAKHIHRLLDGLLDQSQEAPLSHRQIDVVRGASATLCGVPLCLPRYFYQSQQSTSIKLAISPQPKSPNEPVSVAHDTGLTLRVEGVALHGGTPGLFRSIRAVTVSVSSSQTSRAPAVSAEAKMIDNPTNEMRVETDIHHDYFTSQFVFAFPVPGIHKINITTGIVDGSGMWWNAGATASLSVKSYDDKALQQQQRELAVQRQQQRQAAAAVAGKSGINM